MSVKLPIISLSPLTSPNSSSRASRQSVAKEIDHACRSMGFFYIVDHGIPEELCEKVRRLGHEFFSLSDKTKNKYGIANQDYARGYQRLGENVTRYQKDWHEALDYYKPIPRDHVLVQRKLPLRGENQWPTEINDFQFVFEEYVEHMKRLGAQVMSSIALAWGLDENYFVRFLDESFWVMRIIGYPSLTTVEGKDRVGVSCGEHTDYGCLTFLNQDNIKGALQVLTKSGEWINADPVPGAFVVNIGDMLNTWTNDIYKSTLHRVVHTRDEYRVSVPFFYEPNFDALIEPLEPCLKVDPTRHHEPVVYGDHLLSKVSNNFEVEANL
ncbi:1822_t:CDS:10 [Paraglomus occultum]|uniref:1822_t:CDS:1 n=1 Tax=Paraglomus occultum TaxID=144539 RepID=A0A9N9CL41_9GLOM|nr:1822_t:CDS:10 [Paraglomus occultum]